MTLRTALNAMAAAAGVVAFAACGSGGGSVTPTATSTAAPEATATGSAVVTATPEPEPVRNADGTLGPLVPAEDRVVESLLGRFPETVFTRRTVPLTELLDNPNIGRDLAIPAILSPVFVDQTSADGWLRPDEPVVAVEVAGEARAYPIQILMWHELVNDTVGGVPVVVTFCPLCNTALAFDRRVDGEVRQFGVSGLLRRSDLVMFDYTHESLWQQIGGEAIIGRDVPTRLDFIPAQIVSWSDFRVTYPDALVLSFETGVKRPYGENPYRGYDRVGSGMLYPVGGANDTRLDAKERVLTVEVDGDAAAFPFSELETSVVLTTTVGEIEVVAFWQPGTISPLDHFLIVGGRNVGSAGAFVPVLDGERLAFASDGEGRIVDEQTGSVWNVLGRAVEGELVGRQLEAVSSANHFWFAWAVFKPDTRIVRSAD